MSPSSNNQSYAFGKMERAPKILQAGKIDRSLVKDNDVIIVDVSAERNQKVFVRTFNSGHPGMKNRDEARYGSRYETDFCSATSNFPNSTPYMLQQQSHMSQSRSLLHDLFHKTRKRPYDGMNSFQTSSPVYSGYDHSYMQPNATYYSAPQQNPNHGINYASTAEECDTRYNKEYRETYERLTRMADQCEVMEKYVQYAEKTRISMATQNYNREEMLQNLRNACMQRQLQNQLSTSVTDRFGTEPSRNYAGRNPYPQAAETSENKLKNHDYPSLPPPLRRVKKLSHMGTYPDETAVSYAAPYIQDTLNIIPNTDTYKVSATPHTDMYKMNGTPHPDMYRMNGTPHPDTYKMGGTPYTDMYRINGTPHSDTYRKSETPHTNPYGIRQPPHTDMYEMKRMKMSPTDSGIDCTETIEDNLNVVSFDKLVPTNGTSVPPNPSENVNSKKNKGARLKITSTEVEKTNLKPKWMTSKMSSWKKRQTESKDCVDDERKCEEPEHFKTLQGDSITNKPCKKSNLKTVLDNKACTQRDEVKHSLCNEQKHEDTYDTEDSSIPSPMNLVIDIEYENEASESSSQRPKKVIKQFF